MLVAAACVYGQRATVGSNQATVVVRVEDPEGGPFDGSADVSLSANGEGGAQHQMTRDQGQAEFNGIAMGLYYVVVTAPGYKPGEGQVEVGEQMGGEYTTWIRLEPQPNATNTSGASGKPVLAPKAQKLVERGVAALRALKFDEAQKQFQAAYKLAPGNPDVNFFLGYTFLQQKDLSNAEGYLARATSLDPHYGDAFAALGQLKLQQGDLPAAQTALQQGISVDKENWMAHWALASVDLRESRYEDARNEAEAAVQYGKGAANGAEIVIGEAWAGSGDTDKAIDALNAFLRDAPGNSSAPAAQALIAKLTSQKDAEEVRAIALANLARPATPPASAPAKSSATAGVIPGLSDTEANRSLPQWAPSDVDKIKPAVAMGVNCSLPQVLEKAGAKVQELVTNVANIDATEQLVHEQVNELGKPVQTAKVKYDYMANFVEYASGTIGISEHRNGKSDTSVFPANIATPGMISIALVFHPVFRGDFQMTCEGRGDWRGRPAWIVYFRQRGGVAGRVSAFVLNGRMYRINLKGRAWIMADSFEIAHMETDLVQPMADIQFTLEHISADYKPVRFAAGRDLWLPSSADLYFEFRKERYHRRDTFSHYRLFAVSSTQVINQPHETRVDPVDP
jgi:tetratricopeptide (TPR) repeat protein